MPKGELNKVWLVVGIALVVVLVFLLVFFARKGVTAGKAVEVGSSSLLEGEVGLFSGEGEEVYPISFTEVRTGDRLNVVVKANLPAGGGVLELPGTDTIQVGLVYDSDVLAYLEDSLTLDLSATDSCITRANSDGVEEELTSPWVIPSSQINNGEILVTLSNQNCANSGPEELFSLSFNVLNTPPEGSAITVENVILMAAGVLEAETPSTVRCPATDPQQICGYGATIAFAEAAALPEVTASIQETSTGDLNLLIPALPSNTFPIINWLVDADGADGGPAESITVLNMPFEAFTEDLFDDGNDDDQRFAVKDYSGNGNHGRTQIIEGVGYPTFVADGGYNGRGAYSFDGVDDYILTEDSGIVDSSVTTSMTFSAWIKLSSGSTQKQVIMSNRHPNNNDGVFNIYLVNGVLFFGYFSNTASSPQSVKHWSKSALSLQQDIWHHIVWVKTWGEVGSKLFVNGVSMPITGDSDVSGTSVTGSNSGYAQPIYIGVQAGPGQNVLQDYFTGTIDNVRIYNRALSAEQIAAMYDEGIDTTDSTDGIYDTIVSQESSSREVWSAEVTLNDGNDDVSLLEFTSTGVTCLNGALAGEFLLCDVCPAEELFSGGECTEMSVESLDADGTAKFDDGGEIPTAYACTLTNGAPTSHGVNPPLTISGIPDDTLSLAIIMEDTTNPTLHWAVWNIPDPTGNELVVGENSVPSGATEGNSYLGTSGYAGPCPRTGDPAHTYVFNVYALNTMPNFQAGTQLTTSALENAAGDNIIAEAELSGTYNVLCAADNQCGDGETCNRITGLCSSAADLCADIECGENQCRGGLCVPIASCEDEILNGDEEGMDCGGSSCPACTQTLSALDQPCVTEATCASNVCTGRVCSCAENYDRVATICRPTAQVDGLEASIRNILTNNQDYRTLLHKISAIAREFKELMR